MVPLLLVGADIAMLIARIVLAAVFLTHGWSKARDLRANAVMFREMGFRPGGLWGTIAGFVEFGGGLLLAAGLLTQPIALLLAVQMSVAALWRIVKHHSFVGGWEFDVSLIALLLAAATIGGGAFSIDAWYGIYLF